MSTAPPAAPPLPTDLETLLRGLRLPHIRRAAPEVLATARAQRWEPGEVLKALLAEEAAGRARSALASRRAAAAFPTGKTFHAWKPELSSIPAPTQQALRTLEWIDRRENLVVCGPSGTGKTFFLEALGQHAVEPAKTPVTTRDDNAPGWRLARIFSHRTRATMDRLTRPCHGPRPGRHCHHDDEHNRQRGEFLLVTCRRSRVRCVWLMRVSPLGHAH